MVKTANKTISIHDLFLGLQKEMEKSLELTKGSGSTPGSKGSGSEVDWLETFDTYLPKRYQTRKGFVVDSKGSRSDEIDIIVFDRYYSPFLFNHKKIYYVPAESVYCVMEAKPSLNRSVLKYAGKKAESVRKLHRTSAPIRLASGKEQKIELFDIFAGIVVLDSDWKPPLGKSFEKCVGNLKKNERIDLGCVLKHGSFDIEHRNKKKFIKKSNKQTSLIFFFLKLLDRLQRLGNVPAIEMDEYWRVI